MSTPCWIGIKNDDGSIDAVYCHHDGYLRYMLNMLRANYNTEELAKGLVSLGYLPSVKEKLNPTDGSGHSFTSCEPNVTIAYHRDRGEDLQINHCDGIGQFWSLSDYNIKYQYLFYPDKNEWSYWL